MRAATAATLVISLQDGCGGRIEPLAAKSASESEGGTSQNVPASGSTGSASSGSGADAATTIISSANPSTVTSNVTFTFTVTSTTTTTKPPTGTATFYTNSVALVPTVTIVSNTPTSSIATLTTALLPLGTITVDAQYSGDANFTAPLNPASLSQVVQNAACSQTNVVLSITNNGGNSFTLNLLGTYQAQYYVLYQTNAAQPMTNWLAVPGTTNTVTNASGLWSVTVTNPAPAFYRVKAMSVCP